MKDMNFTHVTDLDDLDFMGLVSHYKWVQLFERYRTKYLDKEYMKLTQENLGLVVRKINLHYHKPAKFRDLVVFECKIKNIKNASFAVEQKAISKDNSLYVTAEIEFACIDKELKPTKIPQYLKDR